ncbi:hypothetical protein M011DRAFT_237900 [Sporormia fimetaria CBS 119925]|uniref:Uncharacterized protein n=1 Tax=Sporormia fimetaria CBS 119925 TaxID=1340428 RepID=A0A6A6VKI2_9PLEO|nr:hypothetical protein M011DRAFT_237900 [Sporormia fimetaria CBS 119925]
MTSSPSRVRPSFRRKRTDDLFPRATPTRSNLGPLTTLFTPPTECSRAVLPCQTCSTAWLGLACSSDGGPIDDITCWPPATSSIPRPTPYVSGMGFYSPGISCPAGYTSACTAVSTRPGQTDVPELITRGPFKDGGFQFRLVEGETAVGCCMEGYTCAIYPGGWQTCQRMATATSLRLDQAGSCDKNGYMKELEVGLGDLNIWAPLVQINWQASDRITATEGDVVIAAATPASGSKALSSVASVTGIISTDESVPTMAPASERPIATSKRLSTPFITGISVSAAVTLLAIVSLLAYLWYRKRNRIIEVTFTTSRASSPLTYYQLPSTPTPGSQNPTPRATTPNPTTASPLPQQESPQQHPLPTFSTPPISQRHSPPKPPSLASSSSVAPSLFSPTLSIFPDPPSSAAMNTKMGIPTLRRGSKPHIFGASPTAGKDSHYARWSLYSRTGGDGPEVMESPIEGMSSPFKLKRGESARGRR